MAKCYLWSPAINLDDMKAGVEKALKGAL
jgi:hypothetical protein